MAFKKKKGTKGEANKYVNRNKATKMLQLPLKQFRRLCILKGIYPREPKSRVKAQGGDTRIKTLYHKQDIGHLVQEPIIWKIRDEKIQRRKIHTLKGKNQAREAEFKYHLQAPTYKLDHIVLERYPTFDKALEDLDDPLSAMFLYAALPNFAGIDGEFIHLCKKLTTEFLIYVIESRSLTKAFVSIRGYFYRAHIMGHKITWMIPHPFPIQGSEQVEMRIMKTFIEFYCAMLGFVNYKLFVSLNLYYPPKLAESESLDRSVNTSKRETLVNVIESLNTKLTRNFIDQDEEAEEEYDKELITKKFNKKLKLAQEERAKVLKQQNLFKDIKFFLNRETNRESLTLVIRSAGGLVSWDESEGPGSTFSEDDKSIQYQIVDRPEIEKKYLNRFYIQPQWIYDSFNAGVLLPRSEYFVGTELPAHLSPFEEAYHKAYNPPEAERIKARQNKIELIGDKTIEELKNNIQLSDDDEEEEEEEVEEENKPEEKQEEDQDKGNENAENDDEQKESSEHDAEEMEAEFKDELDNEEKEVDPLAKMKVRRGKPIKVNAKMEQKRKENEDFHLAKSFIHRKDKRKFKKMLHQEKKKDRYGLELRRKRIIYEKEMQKRRIAAAKEKSRNLSFK